MTTCADLIARTRRHLYTETRDERNRLSGAIDASTTSVTFEFDMGGIQPGTLLAVGLEEMHVWSTSSNTATVQRGANGSTASTHADKDMVYVNPKHTDFAIFQALNEDLLDLSSPDNGLFRVRTLQLAFDAGTDTYDLTSVTDLIDVLSVSYNANDGTSRWPTVPRDLWRLQRSQDTSSFASGLSLTVNGYAEPGQSLQIAYKSGFGQMSALTDVVTTATGLPATAVDIPPLGAGVRCTIGAEIARNFLDQGETRRADEVPPGARGAAMRNLLAYRSQRIEAEASRLYAQYPVMR